MKKNMPPASGGTDWEAPQVKESTNSRTLIIDATCAPVNIRYPQDKSYGLTLPRRYRRNARKDYLAFVKSRKHTEKKVLLFTPPSKSL